MSITVKKKYFIIDFDSTFTQVEALDILCEIALDGNPNKEKTLQSIKDITDEGMNGSVTLRESLDKRIKLLHANKSHLAPLVDRLKNLVSKSFKSNIQFLKQEKEQIYIISNGFKDFIDPVVAEYGISSDHVFANNFIFDNNDNIVDIDKSNVLSSNNGKVKQLQQLELDGEIQVIGDGFTDYEIRASGVADKFFAFTENVSRDNVTKNADHIISSLDEFLYINNMKAALSYPKNKIKVLLLEGVHKHGVKLMQEEGYDVEVYEAGLDEDELCEKIKGVSILGIRSKTQVTDKVIKNANRLMAIGAFCIGTNQIDLDAAAKKGIAVFNAPYSNTRSVVELAIGEIIMLIRNLPDKIRGMHNGQWKKSAGKSFEIRGKKLGIIGYGNIGSQLSVMAESMGMNVCYYDLQEKLALGNAYKCNSLDELLSVSDVVTLHVDGRKQNKLMIGSDEFSKMKDGVIFVNLSRGHIVDLAALKENVESGKIGGLAIDVFPYEPKSNNEAFTSDLTGLPNTILTPHIGGSTQEAQKNIATFVPEAIINFINNGSTTTSVNFPTLQLPVLENGHRLIHIHHNVSGVLANISNVLANYNVNILGQYLKTNENIGYVITDINKEYAPEIMNDLKAIENTIKVRILY